ncbi:unnamed protein product [Somion occarium]|uniref:C2 domain-containing protein n=1 Tax=Somion occarium TaxID=3059160 RepID=A0ABP1E8C8_9APHY
MGRELGTLVIVVLKARNLRDKHSFYKQDVFAQVTINGIIKKTSIDVKGGQHPVWDEEVRIPIGAESSEKTRTLYASCWSKEPRGDESVGEGQLDISETLRTGEFDDWIPLKVDGTYRGELYLEMTFYAAGPPPALSRRPTKMKPTERLQRSSQAYAYPTSSPRNSASLPAPGGSSQKDSHLTPAALISPHYKADALPPLPEEADAKPENVPAILRPGKSKTPSPAALQKPLPPDFALHARTPSLQPQPSSPPHIPIPTLPPIYPAPVSNYSNSNQYSYPHGPLFNFPAPESTYLYPQPLIQPPPRPYSYNYAPPPREPEFDLPDPFITARYQTPLPLPNEPEEVNAPAHPRSHAHPVPIPVAATASSSGEASVHSDATMQRSRKEGRDELLAVTLEREQAERRRQLAEQEERDRGLARKLDLELNLG